MKRLEGLKLRKIGSRYMIVSLAENNVNLSEVYTLNETAAGIWERVEESTVEEIADWICGEYEVDRERALADLEAQLDEWEKFGLITR